MKLLLIIPILVGCAMEPLTPWQAQQMQQGFNKVMDGVAAGGGSGIQQPAYRYKEPKRIDYKCMDDCRQMGYLYQFCNSRCSY